LAASSLRRKTKKSYNNGTKSIWESSASTAGRLRRLSTGGRPTIRSTPGMTVWALFPKDSKYFGSTAANFMLNYRVDDLDALLEALAQEGVEIDPKRDDSDYGRFAWITDPGGNRIELWEPPKEK
jgi:catechol 2,3-dioxygenase-like lactoylglutathione lyase family enzyme